MYGISSKTRNVVTRCYQVSFNRLMLKLVNLSAVFCKWRKDYLHTYSSSTCYYCRWDAIVPQRTTTKTNTQTTQHDKPNDVEA